MKKKCVSVSKIAFAPLYKIVLQAQPSNKRLPKHARKKSAAALNRIITVHAK